MRAETSQPQLLGRPAAGVPGCCRTATLPNDHHTQVRSSRNSHLVQPDDPVQPDPRTLSKPDIQQSRGLQQFCRLLPEGHVWQPMEIVGAIWTERTVLTGCFAE
jgi:hypothetical protein